MPTHYTFDHRGEEDLTNAMSKLMTYRLEAIGLRPSYDKYIALSNEIIRLERLTQGLKEPNEVLKPFTKSSTGHKIKEKQLTPAQKFAKLTSAQQAAVILSIKGKGGLVK